MTIRRLRIACWIREATNTHPEYVIPIAVSLQQWLHKRCVVLRYSTSPVLLYKVARGSLRGTILYAPYGFCNFIFPFA